MLAQFPGYSSCTVPYNTSSLRYVMLLSLRVILYCNVGWCVKDSAVHRSRQQWLVAEWLRFSVTVFFFIIIIFFYVETDHEGKEWYSRPQ